MKNGEFVLERIKDITNITKEPDMQARKQKKREKETGETRMFIQKQEKTKGIKESRYNETSTPRTND